VRDPRRRRSPELSHEKGRCGTGSSPRNSPRLQRRQGTQHGVTRLSWRVG
jgi:hypothetical protein